MKPYRIHGALGSPYSIKVRAAFRYWQLAHVWSQGGHGSDVMSKVKVPVIPVVETPDGAFLNDSTPLLQQLDVLHPARSLYPSDPALRFVSLLIEDFADEWLTKAMFLFRWQRAQDQDQMSHWLAFDRMMGQGRAAIDQAADFFRGRQVGRMPIVGCTAETAPVIEESTLTVLRLMEDLALSGPYLFGTRPSIGDFAILGQLSQLAVDPTPQILMRAMAPYTFRWLMNLDDASGVEGTWISGFEQLHPAVFELVRHAAQVYAPYLIANDRAIAEGGETFEVSLMGRPFKQGVFRYQQKCLSVLRAHFASLDGRARETLEPWLMRAGWLATLKGS